MTFFERLSKETEAERHALYNVPIIVDALAGRITRESYIAYLTQAYHHVKHTLPLLMAAGSHIPADKEWVRRAFAEYIEEEIGHEEWILNDIRAAGGDAEAAKHSDPAFATELMTAYAWDTVTRRNPIGFFGMVFVLEGTSTALATRAAEIIQNALQLPKTAFTYLSSHGSLDIKHMKFFEETVNKIEDPKDQEDIIHMAKIIYRLFADMFRGIPHSATAKEAA